MSRRAVLRAAAMTAVAALALTGCQFRGLQDVTLPGGSTGGIFSSVPTYHVTVIFDNVLDLVPQSSVRVNDVAVGDVEKVTLDGFHARVRLRIKKSVKLPANAVARLEQTSLLGEKYVAISAPDGVTPEGTLADGAVIPVDRTDRNPEVEEIFGALSLLLNGGGVEQLQTISQELSAALSGREDKVRDVFVQLKTFLGGLDKQKAEIVRALEGIDRLSATLAKQKQTIATALDDIGPGLKVLADQQQQLTGLFTSLSQLGVVGTRIIKQSKDNTVADLKALQPVLDRLALAGTYLPGALEIVLTYPFPKTATNGIFGDHTGLDVNLDLSQTLQDLCSQNIPVPGLCAAVPGGGLPLPGGGTPTLPGVPSLPSVPSVPLPSVPPIPGVTSGTSSDDGGLLGLLTGGLGG